MATKAKELTVRELFTKHEAVIEYESDGDFNVTLLAPITPDEINCFVDHYDLIYSDHKPQIWVGDSEEYIKITFRQED